MFEGLWSQLVDATSKTGRGAIDDRWSCRLVLTDSIDDRGIWRRPAISEGSFSGSEGRLCCASCNTRRCSAPRLPTVADGRPDELGAPVGEQESKRVERHPLTHVVS